MAGWGMLYTSLILFATVHSEEMTMEPNAVDDAYSDCQEQMLKNVLDRDGFLQKELMTESVFSKAWNETTCLTPIPNGRKEHTQALQSIANSAMLFRILNRNVKTKGENVRIYTEHFNFKSLHFLLMDAMRLLKKEECRTVYSAIFEDNYAVKGNKVRFGRFVSASEDLSLIEEGCADEDGTLFTITSCSVINMEEHLCGKSFEEFVQLISPSEVFTVVDVKIGAECNKEIVLKSAGFKNNHDCYLLPRSATTKDTSDDSSGKGSSTQWASSTGVVLLTIILNMYLISVAL